MNSARLAHGILKSPDATTRPTVQRRHLSALLLAAALAVAGCSSGTAIGISTAPSKVPTTHPTLTPAPASSPTAFAPSQTLAWVATSGTGVADVWISVGGGPARQITHNINDPSGTDLCSGVYYSPPVVSPDGAHLAVIVGPIEGFVCTIDIASGATTAISGSSGIFSADARSIGWLDDKTLWLADGNIATYTLGAADVVTLPGTENAYQAVVRGSTMFYLAATLFGPASDPIAVSLHRYNLSTHAVMGAPISLGAFDESNSPIQSGYVGLQGWDASRDGSQIAYQVTVPAPESPSNPAGIASARVYVAAADGSAPRQILQALPMTSVLDLSFSPDGSQVAATEANPSYAIASGCVASPGASGDPCFHTYTVPDGLFGSGYPIWAPEGRSFLLGNYGPGGGLWRYTIGSVSGSLVWRDGYNPWAA